MRYFEILTEMPVASLSVQNMDKPGTFPDVDRKLLNNPKHIQNIHKRFNNVPFDFHLYFVNRTDVQYLNTYEFDDEPTFSNPTQKYGEDIEKYAGPVSEEDIKALLGIDISPDPDGIVVVFTSNTNDSSTAIPLTPWMVAHRFGHAIFDGQSKLSEYSQKAIYELERIVNSSPIWAEGYTVKTMLNFRSARNGKLSIGEDMPELVAQYCTSRIKLRVPPKANVTWGDKLIHAERALNVQLDRLIEGCVGYIFLSV